MPLEPHPTNPDYPTHLRLRRLERAVLSLIEVAKTQVGDGQNKSILHAIESELREDSGLKDFTPEK